MSALTDMLRDPAMQEKNMSPMHRGTPKQGMHRYGAGKARPQMAPINPGTDPWGSLGQGLGNMATKRWGQKDLEGNLVPGQNLGGILARKLKGMM